MQKENKKNLIMLVSGLVLIVISVGIFLVSTRKQASAVDIPVGKDWAERWDITGMETVKMNSVDDNTYLGRICIGPSSWGVQGNISGQAYSETWTISGVASPSIGSYNGNTDGNAKVNISVENVAWNPSDDTTCQTRVLYKGGGHQKVFFPGGSYGLSWMKIDGTQTDSWGENGSITVMPSAWTVSGKFD